jgi:hypothetical protein
MLNSEYIVYHTSIHLCQICPEKDKVWWSSSQAKTNTVSMVEVSYVLSGTG